MSDAKQCDRCGKLYVRYSGLQFTETGSRYNNITLYGTGFSKDYDLCIDCMRQLIRWLKNESD